MTINQRFTMKVLITGATGQLGWELQRSAPSDTTVLAVDVTQLDITDADAVSAMVTIEAPDLIINCAAYTAVDKAEGDSALAYAINQYGAEHLAKAAAANNAKLIHISTDFVFDGRQSSPYKPDAPANPLNVYGASKLEGERAVLACLPSAIIVRTSWVYSSHGNNFVKTMLKLMAERDALSVVSDQIGTPTYAYNLAKVIWQLNQQQNVTGIYHYTDSGVASWYDFACAIQEEAIILGLLDRQIPIFPIPASTYPTPATRPSYSVLDKQSLIFSLNIQSIHWRQPLRDMLGML